MPTHPKGPGFRGQAIDRLVIFPGIAVGAAVLNTKPMGDAIRDFLDPRPRQYTFKFE